MLRFLNHHGNSSRRRFVIAGMFIALLALDHIIALRYHAGPNEFITNILLVIIATALGTAIGALVITYRFRLRLSGFIDMLRLVAAGDSTVRADIKTMDELGELNQAFNSMAESLSQTHDILAEKANTDSLTGLYNHRYFQERLASEFNRAIRYGSTLSLIMIDIDQFKCYNEINGHPAGDQALKDIAAIISEQARDVDILARYGGEEFAIILPETNYSQAEILGQRINTAIEEHVFEFANPECNELSLSIGIAEYPSNCSDRTSLVRTADESLCRIKIMKRKGKAA